VSQALADGSALTLSLQTKNDDGLPSTAQTRNFTVNYADTSTPTVAVSPQVALGVIRLTITNPTAGLSTFVNVGAAASGDNVSVQPALPASLQADDTMVCLASIRNSGTGTVNTPSGWVQVVAFGNMALLARRYVVGDTAPTITFSGGAAGADTIAQIAAFRGMSESMSGVATVLNGSAQNIAYPSLSIAADKQVVLVLGWKQDDWTSVAQLGGMTEIGEGTSTAGSDAGQVWDYVIQTTAANITGSSFTVTGGISAISRGITVALDTKPALSANEIYRREVGDTSEGVRVAKGLESGAVYDDYTATSGVAYEYRVKAVGVNGSGQYGAWTS
jgi:hypothetical protein